MPKLQRIITGGQTGADRGGWHAAERMGLATGGTMGAGYLAEDGPHPEFAERFNVRTIQGNNYADRRRANYYDCDGVIVFNRGWSPSSGTQGLINDEYTVKNSRGSAPPILTVNLTQEPDGLTAWVSEKVAAEWIRLRQIETLMIAGNRESKCKGIEELVESYLSNVFRYLGFRVQVSRKGQTTMGRRKSGSPADQAVATAPAPVQAPAQAYVPPQPAPAPQPVYVPPPVPQVPAATQAASTNAWDDDDDVFTLTATAAVQDTEPAPAGIHPARVVGVVDIGTQVETYNGETKDVEQVIVIWELCGPARTKEGETFIMAERFTQSLNAKSKLAILISSVTGQKFNPGDKFNVLKVLGMPCQVQVMHTPGKGDRSKFVYANIENVMGWPVGVPFPSPPEPIDIFKYTPRKGKPCDALGQDENPWLPYVYGRTIEELIKDSREYKSFHGGPAGYAPGAARPAAGRDGLDHDGERVPF